MNQSYDWWRVALALIVVLMGLGAPYLSGRRLWARPRSSIRLFRVKLERSRKARSSTSSTGSATWSRLLGRAAPCSDAIVAFMSGRHMGRWLIAAAALLAVSGLTRLLEFWVLQGTGGVS